jgi:hypothetical protein
MFLCWNCISRVVGFKVVMVKRRLTQYLYEYRCNVFYFNVTGDVHLPEGFHGGLACCQDEAMCHVGEAFQGENGEKLARNLHFRVCAIR